MAEAEYVLGTDAIELDRLREQHEVWSHHARTLWERAGFRGLATLLDLGCGPGFTTLELADFAGPETRILAVDESPSFLAALRSRLAELTEGDVEPLEARVEALELAEASVDGAYARWLFSWLPAPGEALRRVARALRPGARLALHEYLHWGSFSLLPPHPAHESAVRACLASWEDVHIDVAARMAAYANHAGLELEHLEPIARGGAPGSPVWRWLEDFHRSYLPRLVERGLMSAAERDGALEAWEHQARLPGARVLAPTMAGVILRKP